MLPWQLLLFSLKTKFMMKIFKNSKEEYMMNSYIDITQFPQLPKCGRICCICPFLELLFLAKVF